jgi:hypothetical protein
VKTTWPFLDFVAVLEQAGTEKALHARPQIDLFQRLSPTDELGLLGHRSQLGRRNQHRRRRTALLAKCGQTGQCRKREQSKRKPPACHRAPTNELM